MRPRHNQRRAVLALLGGAFVLFEWPILVRPLSSAFGFPAGDFAQTLWNFYAVREALVAWHSPFTTTLLFNATPASLFYHTLNLLYFILAAPVYLPTTNPIAAYNLCHLAAGGLGLVCFYRLARFLGAGRRPAAVAAVCFAWSPYYLQRVTTLNMMSTWLVALYALCLMRMWRKARTRDAVWTGLCIAGFLLGSWHYLVFCALATPLLILYETDRSGGPPLLGRRRLRLGAAALAVAAPLLALYVALAARHDGLSAHATFQNPTRIRCAASPFYYVVPGWLEGPWMNLIEPLRRPEIFAYRTGHERTLYLGLVALALAAAKFRRRRPWRRERMALVAALLFFVLSLGPALIVFAPVTLGPDRMILLPGNYLALLPVFSSIRHMTRFGLMVLLFLLMASVRGRKRLFGVAGRRASLALAVALILAHYADVYPHFKWREAWKPPVGLMHALQSSNLPPGPAMTMPAYEWQSEGLGMYLQTIHHRTLVSGYLSRNPVEGMWGSQAHIRFYWELAGAAGLAPRPTPGPPPEPDSLPAILALHRRRLGPYGGAVERVAESYGFRTDWRGEEVVVMRRAAPPRPRMP